MNSKNEKPTSFLKRWSHLPESRTHWLLTLVVLVAAIFLLIKWAS